MCFTLFRKSEIVAVTMDIIKKFCVSYICNEECLSVVVSES